MISMAPHCWEIKSRIVATVFQFFDAWLWNYSLTCAVVTVSWITLCFCSTQNKLPTKGLSHSQPPTPSCPPPHDSAAASSSSVDSASPAVPSRQVLYYQIFPVKYRLLLKLLEWWLGWKALSAALLYRLCFAFESNLTSFSVANSAYSESNRSK